LGFTTKAFATAFTGLLAALIFAYAAFGGAADVGVLGMMVGIIMYGAPLSSTLGRHHGMAVGLEPLQTLDVFVGRWFVLLFF
jgi:hypothetical protein